MNKAKASAFKGGNDKSSLNSLARKKNKTLPGPEKNTDIINHPCKSGQTCQVLTFLSKKVTEVAAPAEIISDTTSGMDVLTLLEKYNVLLVSKKYEVVGIITDMSIVRNIMKMDIEKLTAGDLCQEVITIDSSKNVRQAIKDMDGKGATVLAVTNKSAIFGIITAPDLRKFLAKRSKSEVYPQEGLIETKIDEFISLIRRGPIGLKEVEKAIGVNQDQIESWMEVLENQNIMKIEKHFGKLVIKDERKI